MTSMAIMLTIAGPSHTISSAIVRVILSVTRVTIGCITSLGIAACLPGLAWFWKCWPKPVKCGSGMTCGCKILVRGAWNGSGGVRICSIPIWYSCSGLILFLFTYWYKMTYIGAKVAHFACRIAFIKVGWICGESWAILRSAFITADVGVGWGWIIVGVGWDLLDLGCLPVGASGVIWWA